MARKSRVCRVLVAGPLGPFADAYREAIEARGYSPLSAVNLQRQVAWLSRWLGPVRGIERQQLSGDQRPISDEIIMEALKIGDELVFVEQEDVVVEPLLPSDSVDRGVELPGVRSKLPERQVEVTQMQVHPGSISLGRGSDQLLQRRSHLAEHGPLESSCLVGRPKHRLDRMQGR